MSNPEMKGARILRFHTSDKVFHSINAICWYALVITGAIVYFGHWMGDISDETANLMMVWHLWLGALFTLNFVGYVLFAPERFAVTLKNLLEWDRNTIMWFRNFGGYPRRFFKIPLFSLSMTRMRGSTWAYIRQMGRLTSLLPSFT